MVSSKKKSFPVVVCPLDQQTVQGNTRSKVHPDVDW